MSVRARAALVLSAFVLVTLALVAAPAAGSSEPDPADPDQWIVLSGRVDLPEDDEVDYVFVLHGDTDIAGTVDGTVVVVDGDVQVTGDVRDDVLAFNGRIAVEDGANVGGDVRSSKTPVVSGGATVDGTVERTNFANLFQTLGVIVWIVWWIAVTVSTFVLGVLFLVLVPRAARGALVAARTSVGPVIGWGVAATFGLPVVAIFLLFTVLGIPLGLAGLLAAVPLFALGYVAGMYFLGRTMIREPKSPYLALLVGWAILRVVELVPVLGPLVTLAAVVYGLGSLTVAAWRAGRGRSSDAAPVVTQPPPGTPPPVAPTPTEPPPV